MTDILTVTMNPALDVSANTARMRPTSKLRCDRVQRHPGGGGINVARVLHRLGADCAALCLLGGPTGQMLSMLLQEEGVHCIPVAIGGHTRESFTVLDDSTAEEYRFVLPGPVIHPDELGSMMALLAWQPAPDFVVASGSLPPGMPVDFYEKLANISNAWGARLVVDGSGAALAAALDRGVYMVKPSLRELRELTGLPLTCLKDVANAAGQWVGTQRATVVAVSLGEQGALLVTDRGAWYAPAIPVKAVSAVGAGDSFVAGMVWSLARGDDVLQAFVFGVAAGASAVMSAGTGLSTAADIHRMAKGVSVLSDLPELVL